MKPFASKHSHIQNNLKEHTPVYDMAAFRRKSRQLKLRKRFKNLIEGGLVSLIVGLTITLLFLGH